MKNTTILLSLSLLINIFLVGYLTGNQFLLKKMGTHRDFKHGHFDKEIHKELKSKRDELFEIIVAPEFNEAAFDAKIKELESIHDTLKSKMPERLKRQVLGKSQEERIKLIEKIKRKHRHRM